MLADGLSWSGNERNCCFLNSGSPRFADVSAVSGFDFPGDGRAVGIVDWDQDGRLDMWLTNRTSPRVRFLRNAVENDHHFLALHLEGNGTTSNRDAIGARVEVLVRGPWSVVRGTTGKHNPTTDQKPRLVRTLRAGEGFLTQSSKVIHFGLGTASSIERVVVRWPDGQVEEFGELEIDRRYKIKQGSGSAQPWKVARGPVRLVRSELNGSRRSDRARIALTGPIPMPRLSYLDSQGKRRPLSQAGQPRLVNLWSTTCAPCLVELRNFAEKWEQLESGDLNIVAVCVDQKEARKSASAMLEQSAWRGEAGFASPEFVHVLDQLQRGLLGRKRPLPAPTSFLVDRDDRLLAIYKGPVEVPTLLADLQLLGSQQESFAALPFAGRWIQSPDMSYRNQLTLVVELTEAGYPEIAGPYLHELADTAKHTPERDNVLAERFVDLGLALFAKGNRRQGVHALRRAIELNPELPRAHYNLGMTLLSEGEADDAIAHFRQSVKSDPDFSLVYFPLASELAKQGEVDEAIRYFRRAIQADPEHLESHSQLAMLLFRQGKLEEALSPFQAAAQINHEDPALHYNLGQVLTQLQRHDEAIGHLEEAIRLRPDLAIAHFRLAELMIDKQLLERAEIHFRNAIRHQADFGPAHFKLASLLMQMGQAQGAIEHFGAVLRTDPSHVPAKNNLAWLLATHPDDDVRDGERALRLASEAVQSTGGTNATLLETLSAAQAEQQLFDAAIITAKRSLKVAQDAGDPSKADQLQRRLELYDQRQPYRDKSLTKRRK